MTELVHDHSGYEAVSDVESESVASWFGSSSSGFCHGSGMTMYMDGFHFSLFNENQPCLNLWFASWKLDNVGKFVLAMLGVFLLGVGTEGMGAIRRKVSASRHTSPTSSSISRRRRMFYVWAQRGLYGVQGTLGYFLMLAVMTYSTELLISCLFGVTIGYTLFTDNNNHDAATNSNPCCDFMNQPQHSTTTTTTTVANLSNIDVHPLLSSSENIESGIVRKRHAQQNNNNSNSTAMDNSDDELGNCCGSKST